MVDIPPSIRQRPGRLRRTLVAVCISVTLVLVGAVACDKTTKSKETVETLRTKSPTLHNRTQLRIVVRDTIPLMGYRDPKTGRYTGFEIELANAVAAELGFTEERIEWVTVNNLGERQAFLQNGLAQMTVASFSITPEREQFVDFAGPYLLVPQAVMVRRDRRKSLETIADLRSKDVRVCTLTGSTSEKALKEQGITPDPVDKHDRCVDGMKTGRYDAFSSDLTILAGFLSADKELFEIQDMTITGNSERLGIAVPNGDTALRDLVAHILHRWQTGPPDASPWLRAFDHTIGQVLDPRYRSQPLVDNPPDLADYDSKAPKP
jgi:glutamate transport system substrate-binding protein